MSKYSLIWLPAGLGLAMALMAGSAWAQADAGAGPHGVQPLETFVAAAKQSGLDSREQEALVARLEHERQAAAGARLPSLSANASYTRNQDEAAVRIPAMDGAFEEAVITPQNQVDASVTLTVPLIELGAWQRVRASEHSVRAGRYAALATDLNVTSLVIDAYYQYLAALATGQSATTAHAAAVRNLEVVRSQIQAGRASELDEARAMAEVERAQQSIADADLSRALAARLLTTASGIAPAPTASGATIAIPDDLGPEAPLARWLGSAEATPLVAVRRQEAEAATATAAAARLDLVPTVSASASLRGTNATGFGDEVSYTLGVSASWRLDATTVHTARAQRAAAEVAAIRAAKTVRDTRATIEDAWNQVEALRARCTAAAAEVRASTRAAEVARDRYAAGLATQLDVIQAERDAFAAEVARIQALAELAKARARLRLAAGMSIRSNKEIQK